MDRSDLKVLIAGTAGQGLATIGQLLAKSLVRAGYYIVVTQDYQSRIRGGHNTFAIRASSMEIASSREGVDLLLALNQEAIVNHQPNLSPQGAIIADETLEGDGGHLIKVPFKEFGSARTANVAALGVASVLIGLEEKTVGAVIEDFFGPGHMDEAEENRKVLSRAYTWPGVRDNASLKLDVSSPAKRVMLSGNEAIALGALSAGVKFCSFYPMTPATSISLTLAAQAGRMGLVVEQAEDEIAAINMALGASFAGAPSMVATSGGGFALMTEGVSLAAMTETPVVIAVAQRPGPATGLPTRTAQGDLEFVLHSGHGEFPRAVFAPGSIEECFHLTRTAFFLAHRAQGPVFILTDQFLADSYRAVIPFDVEGLAAINPLDDAGAAGSPYVRYEAVSDGASPRLIPGLTPELVVADSDAHTPDGHLTEDLEAAQVQTDKRLRKIELLLNVVLPPEQGGDLSPDLLLVSWGSSQGAVREAARLLKKETGRSVGTIHFSQVWPLKPEYFMDALEEAGEVAFVEGNAFGQFARLIRRETGFQAHRQVLRYDGLPLTPEFILTSLRD